MVAMDLKQEIRSLQEARVAVELEMNSIISRLSDPLPVPLVSVEISSKQKDFRELISIFHQLRSDRHSLSELRNDYKDVTDKIAHKLEVLHSARLHTTLGTRYPVYESGSTQATYSGNRWSTSRNDSDSEGNLIAVTEGAVLRRHFAAIDEISDGSLAALDGIQLGDQIVKFGNVEGGNELLQRLASESTTNQGRPIPVVVLRQGSMINLQVAGVYWGATFKYYDVSAKRFKVYDYTNSFCTRIPLFGVMIDTVCYPAMIFLCIFFFKL